MKDVLLFARVGQESLPPGLRKRYQILDLRLAPQQIGGDFNTDARSLRQLLGQRWNQNAYDLLNVVCGLRAADRYFTEKGFFQGPRKLRLAVGVSESKRWKALAQPLAESVRALSEDTLEFYPLALPKLPTIAQPEEAAHLQLAPDTSGRAPDCVCLYSGGADSFAGVAHLLSQGRRPVLVSHSVGPISGLQKRLFEVLRARFPALEPHWLVQFRSQPHTTKIKREARGRKLFWRTNDNLQRLRSIFFFSVAGIIAKAIGVKEIFMCENGLIGAAIVFSSRDDNPSTTRPAEPHYLKSMEKFLRQALDFKGLQIRNPFQYMTKGEVLMHAVSLDLCSALYQTVSCWRSGNRGVRNCGQCVPCLFRQLAFDEADLPPPPPKYEYRHPIPKRNWRDWNSRELERLEDIRQYCKTGLEGGTRWFFENELAVVDAIDVTHGPTRRRHGRAPDQNSFDDKAPRKMAQVISRFAEATLKRLP